MSRTGDNSNLPSDKLAWEEFVEINGVQPEHISEIVSLGWIDSRPGTNDAIMFRNSDIYKIRQLERICGAFELPVIGGTIIVDLLDRIDRLERVLRQLHGLER